MQFWTYQETYQVAENTYIGPKAIQTDSLQLKVNLRSDAAFTQTSHIFHRPVSTVADNNIISSAYIIHSMYIPFMTHPKPQSFNLTIIKLMNTVDRTGDKMPPCRSPKVT